MMTYSLTCDEGHEPETFTVEAENDEEAMALMMAKSKGHADIKHPEMLMTEEEVKAFISSHWTKS